MSDVPYTFGSQVENEPENPEWRKKIATEQLPITISNVVDAKDPAKGPQRYAEDGERLDIALHKKAQALVQQAGLGNFREAYDIVNQMIEKERARRATPSVPSMSP